MQLIFIVIIIFSSVGLYFYSHHKKSKILPKQIIEVKELINILNQSELAISFCIYDPDAGVTIIEKPVSVNFFSISKFSSKKLYDDFEDDLVLFEGGSNLLFETKGLTNSKMLPKIILDELSDFQNTKLSIMEFDDNDDRPRRFVAIKSGLWEENKDPEINNSEEFIIGNALAFDNWMNLKDHVEQLEFVISQWLKDAGIEENEIRSKFELHEQKV